MILWLEKGLEVVGLMVIVPVVQSTLVALVVFRVGRFLVVAALRAGVQWLLSPYPMLLARSVVRWAYLEYENRPMFQAERQKADVAPSISLRYMNG